MDPLTEQIINKWNEYEIDFRANDYQGNFGDEQVRITPRGNKRLVLSSVHGIKHLRQDEEKIKEEDEGTGGLCWALGELLDITTAVVLDGKLTNDANHDINHPIKNELTAAGLPPKNGVLIDLHGVGIYSQKNRKWFKHEQDIVIGMGKKPIATDTALRKTAEEGAQGVGKMLTSAFHEENMVVDLGGDITTLRAGDVRRMTMWAQNQGISAVQIEILDAFRQANSTVTDRARLVRALVAGINQIQKAMA